MESNKRRVARWPAEVERRASGDLETAAEDGAQLVATGEITQGEDGPRAGVHHIDQRTGEVTTVDAGPLQPQPRPPRGGRPSGR